MTVTRWTDEETATLRRMFACGHGHVAISDALPGRTPDAVKRRAYDLALRHEKHTVSYEPSHRVHPASLLPRLRTVPPLIIPDARNWDIRYTLPPAIMPDMSECAG